MPALVLDAHCIGILKYGSAKRKKITGARIARQFWAAQSCYKIIKLKKRRSTERKSNSSIVRRCCSTGPGKRGHIVSDTNVSPFALTRIICCGHKCCVRDTKSVFDFVQKHFVSATNVSQFAQPKKYHGQQCVRNNVSSFTRALRLVQKV